MALAIVTICEILGRLCHICGAKYGINRAQAEDVVTNGEQIEEQSVSSADVPSAKPPSHILITGGTGFIGQELVRRLLSEGHELTILVRDYARARLQLGPKPRLVRAFDELESGERFSCVINLAGAGIADRRWSRARKKVLLESRIRTTRHLVRTMRRLHTPPDVLLSASATGFYGDGGDRILTETSPAQDEFSNMLCRRWEEEAYKAESLGVRVCVFRLGVVLHPRGGMLKKLLPLYRLGLGGVTGHGQQYFSWVHLDDVLTCLEWLMQTRESGAFNLCAPEPVKQRELAQQLGKAVRRPTFMRQPEFLIQAMLGEMGDRLLLHGQRAVPQRLQALRFQFKYPTMDRALASFAL